MQSSLCLTSSKFDIIQKSVVYKMLITNNTYHIDMTNYPNDDNCLQLISFQGYHSISLYNNNGVF